MSEQINSSTEPLELSAVFYTDGSYKTVTGYGTYGVHGYSYTTAADKPYSYKYEITDLGYFPKPKSVNDDTTLLEDDSDELQNDGDTTVDGFEDIPINQINKAALSNPSANARQIDVFLFEGEKKFVQPYRVHDIYGCVGQNTSSNIAELEATKSALQCAVNNGYKNINIITDSSSAAQCFNHWLDGWSNNGWKKRDGSSVKNLEYMQNLHQFTNDLKANGYKYQCYWIQSHSGHYGNERADQNADYAHTFIRNGHSSNYQLAYTKDSKSFYKHKSERPVELYLPTLIVGSRTGPTSSGDYVYISSNREKKYQLYGTKSAEATYSVYISKTPIEYVESIRKASQRLGCDNDNYIFVDVQKLYSVESSMDISDFDSEAFVRTDHKSFVIGTVHCTDIATQLDTPIMTHGVFKICEAAIVTARNIDNNPNIRYVDITDQIFDITEKNGKTNRQLKSSIKHTDKTIRFNIPLFGTVGCEEFIFGQDIAPRAIYKNIEKTNARVFLCITEDQGSRSWKYISVCSLESTKINDSQPTFDWTIITVPGYSNVRLKLTEEELNQLKETVKKRKAKK